MGGQIPACLSDLREAFVEVLMVPRIQDRFAARSDPNGAIAVQLNFVDPIRPLRECRNQGALH